MLYFLCQFTKLYLFKQLLIHVYTAIKPILCSSIAVWLGTASKKGQGQNAKASQDGRTIICANLHSIKDSYIPRARKQAGNIPVDTSYHKSKLVPTFPFGEYYKAPYTKTNRFNCFLLTVINNNPATSPFHSPCLLLPLIY